MGKMVPLTLTIPALLTTPWSNSVYAVARASARSSSSSFRLTTSWPYSYRYVGLTPPETDCQPLTRRMGIAIYFVLRPTHLPALS